MTSAVTRAAGAAKPPWYANGLRFTCTQCGHCCTGDPGFTWLSDAEADALAARLGLDGEAFRRRYTRTVWRDGRAALSLTERGNGDCIFWRTGIGCSVYDLRPQQCRTWPFWRRVVKSRAAWNEAARDCPGMDHGALHDAATIARTAVEDGLPA